MICDFHLLSYCLMTFTAQALLSLSFLACTPLQQVSILVAEDVKKKKSVLYSHNKTAWYILCTPCVVAFTSFFLFSEFSLSFVSFVFGLEPCCCKFGA